MVIPVGGTIVMVPGGRWKGGQKACPVFQFRKSRAFIAPSFASGRFDDNGDCGGDFVKDGGGNVT